MKTAIVPKVSSFDPFMTAGLGQPVTFMSQHSLATWSLILTALILLLILFETRFKLAKTAGRKKRAYEGDEYGQNKKEDGKTVSEFTQSLAEILKPISNPNGRNVESNNMIINVDKIMLSY